MGFEFVCGILGLVGGVLYMNVGVYGGEILFVLIEVVVMIGDGELCILMKEVFEFGYCKSVFVNNYYIIFEVRFEFEEGVYEEIKVKMDDLMFKCELK